MAWFKSKQQADVETLRAKIAEAEQTLADAEADLAAKALEAALSPDPHPAAGPLQKVREARDRLEVLRHGLAAAIAEEDRRQREKRAELRASQNRAIAQHASRAVKAAQRYETAITNAVSAYRELLEIGPTIETLLPPNMVETYRKALSVYAIREACHDELARQGRDNPNDPAARAPFPGTEGRGGSSWYPGQVRPLAEALQERLRVYHAMLVGKTEKPAEPEPTATAEPEIPAAIRMAQPFIRRAEPAPEAVADA